MINDFGACMLASIDLLLEKVLIETNFIGILVIIDASCDLCICIALHPSDIAPQESSHAMSNLDSSYLCDCANSDVDPGSSSTSNKPRVELRCPRSKWFSIVT